MKNLANQKKLAELKASLDLLDKKYKYVNFPSSEMKKHLFLTEAIKIPQEDLKRIKKKISGYINRVGNKKLRFNH